MGDSKDGEVIMASGSRLSRRSHQHLPGQFLLLDGSASAHGACKVVFPDGCGRNLLESAGIKFVGPKHHRIGPASSSPQC